MYRKFKQITTQIENMLTDARIIIFLADNWKIIATFNQLRAGAVRFKARIINRAKMVNKWYVSRRATPIVDDAQPLSNDGYLATRGFAAFARAERKQINRDRLWFVARALNASFNIRRA